VLEPLMKFGRRQLGFTMVEMMIVVVLAGVLLAIATPSFRDMLERRRLEGQANELVTDLAYAKSEAVARNRNVVLITGGGGICYTIAAWTGPASRAGSCNCASGATVACTTGANNPEEIKTVALVNSATVSSGVTFDFEPVRGSLQPVAPATIASAASAVVALGSRNYTVDVSANGRVSSPRP
jgi:type IV fimbrial biogenesis protein FimT